MRTIKFFSQRDIDEQDYILFAESMEHKYMPKGRMVFDAGSIGDMFYIILSGEAAVYINIPKDSEGILLFQIYQISYRKLIRHHFYCK